ncbi:hypothetical protein ONZ45_g9101 [Pleurotus djamor]|nr:hypothetical protein ONZ45_g9101 [Pleurotus djamor]
MDAFLEYLAPILRSARQQGESSEFFRALWLILFDRFPLKNIPSDPNELRRATLHHQRRVGFRLVMRAGRTSGAFSGHWRDVIKLAADRAKRRAEWNEHGNGLPPTSHQYIIAFEEDIEVWVDCDEEGGPYDGFIYFLKRALIEVEHYPDTSTVAPIHRLTDVAVTQSGFSTTHSYYNATVPIPEDVSAGNDTDLPVEVEGDVYYPDNSEDNTVDPLLNPRIRSRLHGDNPLLTWIPYREEFVSELLNHEAPLCDIQICGFFYGLHRMHHLTTSLISLPWPYPGFRLQLGHKGGEPCPNPQPAFRDGFVVICLQGVQTVGVDFCGCTQAVTRHVQLLQYQLFPATVIEPRTAATFEVLRFFQLLSFTSKVSAHAFYKGLERLSNNLGRSLPDRYISFLRIIREWRHVLLLKRSGSTYGGRRVADVEPGELSVLCPACPHPGKNLPEGYLSEEPSKRWLYTLFLAIDANFRLKRLASSSDSRDPGLSTGLAYFVDEGNYKQFLASADDQPNETNTCNNYDAVKLASARGGHGTTASGVGTIECSRHDMKRPLSVGDLQKGERYVNMDYLFFSSIGNHSPNLLNISYDIACQWDYCQVNYSFNLTPDVGRTDGESPERGWAAMNPVASSTKEMGPGSRRDTLDDHFGDYNWRKVVIIDQTLLSRFKEAVSNRSVHYNHFIDLGRSLPPASVNAFNKAVWDWEASRTKVNPYEAKNESVAQAKIRLDLAKEDAEAIARDEQVFVHHAISPSVLVSQGLDLQEQQVRLQRDRSNLGTGATLRQQAAILERGNRLSRRITVWNSIADSYIPGISQHAASSEDPVSLKVLLPSDVITLLNGDTRLAEYEWRLRYGQCLDFLSELRRLLLLLSSMYRSKDALVRGQHHNSRSVTLVKNVQTRIHSARDSYRSGRSALVTLGAYLGKSGWESVLKVLADSDLRSLGTGEDAANIEIIPPAQQSEGHRVVSWIWAARRPDTGTEMTQGMNEGKLPYVLNSASLELGSNDGKKSVSS